MNQNTQQHTYYDVRVKRHFAPLTNKFLMLFSFILILSLVFSFSGCKQADSNVTTSAAKPENAQSTSQTSTVSDEDKNNTTTTNKTNEEQEDQTNNTISIGQLGDPFILSDAQTHTYTNMELSALSAEEIRIARNELYARHGRIFHDAYLNEYFSKKEWYEPKFAGADFDETVFNEIELENLTLLLSLEAMAKSSSTPLSYPQIPTEQFPKIDGSTATIPISQAIYRLMTGASQEEAQQNIMHYKTSTAYKNLQYTHSASPNLVIAYAPSEELLQELQNNSSNQGTSLIIKPIGKDALVFMANEQNPVRSLTQKQLVDIYTGTLTNWKHVGGSNQTIEAFQRPKASGSQNLMEKLVIKENQMAKAPSTHIFGEMGDILDALSEYDNSKYAIGYSVYYYAKNMYEKPQLRFMEIDDVLPSNTSIRNGSYPYISDFYAAIRSDEPKDSYAYQIFDWLTTEDGQALINGLGYVGLSSAVRILPEEISDLTESIQTTAITNNDTNTNTNDTTNADNNNNNNTTTNNTTNTNTTKAVITLQDGFTLIGDGNSFLGEQGLVVFDEAMQEEFFLPNVSTRFHTLLSAVQRDEPLLLCDMDSMLWGAYSLEKKQWILKPNYSTIEQNKNGFFLELEISNSNSTDTDSSYVYEFADLSGTITARGSSDEMNTLFWHDIPESLSAYSEDNFILYFPEILSKHQVTETAVRAWYPYSEGRETAFTIQQDNMFHVYSPTGQYLLSFDENELRKDFIEDMKEISDFRFYIQPPEKTQNERLAILTVPSDGYSISRIYQDGKEILKLSSENTGGYISCVGDGFYVVSVGNYISVYNFDGKLCRSFLAGWLRND